MKFILTGFLICLLSSCMIGPKYSRPCLPIQRTWVNDPQTYLSLEDWDDPAWWHVFNDPTLDELIESAYLQNRDLEISGIRVYQAYAALSISIGQLFPQYQQLQATHSHNEISENIANVPGNTSFHDNLVNFLATWEIDLWGKFRHGVAASKANVKGNIYTYRDVLQSLIGKISQVYMQIRGFNQKITLLIENIQIQKKTVNIVETKHRLGQTSGLDVQQAISVLENTKAALETQILQKKLAENFLCTLLGSAPFNLEKVYPIKDSVPQFLEIPKLGIPIDLIRNRPDIRAVEQSAIAQANIVGIAQTELLPSLTLSGFFGWESENQSNLFGAYSGTSSFAQSIGWNIFNYGRLTSNVRLQNAILQEILVNYQSTVINACREVEDGIASFYQNKKAVTDLTKAVNATGKTLDLSMTQYNYGAIEFLNVLTAQTNLVQQQLSLIDAQVAYVNSFIAIQTSLGKGWEFKECEDFIFPCNKKKLKNLQW